MRTLSFTVGLLLVLFAAVMPRVSLSAYSLLQTRGKFYCNRQTLHFSSNLVNKTNNQSNQEILSISCIFTPVSPQQEMQCSVLTLSSINYGNLNQGFFS